MVNVCYNYERQEIIMEKKYQLFIYGYCQKGQRDHNHLKECKYKNMDIIKGWNMILLNDFPIAVKNKNIYNMGSMIIVEHYEVTESVIHNLDKYFNVPEYYNRDIVKTVTGKRGILYFAEENKSKLKGTGTFIPNGDWLSFQKYENKKELTKKRRSVQKKLEEETKNKNLKKKLEEKRNEKRTGKR